MKINPAAKASEFIDDERNWKLGTFGLSLPENFIEQIKNNPIPIINIENTFC